MTNKTTTLKMSDILYDIKKKALNFEENERERYFLIGIIGPFRGGKSFLLNCLNSLANKNNSIDNDFFKTSSLDESCTKGIYSLNFYSIT